MNRLVIFDLDGVLIESRELHYESLNAALERVGKEYIINRDEHLAVFDGLNTTRKLDLLTEKKGLPKSSHQSIWENKQKATFDLIKKFPRDERIVQTMQKLKENGWKIAVCSNSIRETIKLALISIGVIEYVDYYVSNEDAKPKPYPEMYWKAMTAMNALPRTTVIVEDSHIGRQGAIDSGAHLLAVENSNDWTFESLISDLNNIMENKKVNKKIAWRDKRLQVLIPMAGAGSRFANAGYTFPKPLIEVRGVPMIEVVVNNLNIEAQYIFLCQRSHYDQYDLESLLNRIAPNCRIVLVDGLTEGACCTSLLAEEYIDNDRPLLIANSDQFIDDFNSNEILYSFKNDAIDSGYIVFRNHHPKWSYAKLGDDGFVSEVREKTVISDLATVGIYYFSKGSDYVKYSKQMIAENDRHNNEFYIAPVANYFIRDGKKVKVKEVKTMRGLGTPEDLTEFLSSYKGEV